MILFLLSLFLSVSAAAGEDFDDSIDIAYFRPPPDGMRYYGVPSASTMRHLQLGISMWGVYENDPLIIYSVNRRVVPPEIVVDSSMDIGDAPVDNRFMGNVQFSLGLFDHLSLSLDLPLIFWQSGYSLYHLEEPGASPQHLISSGVGDLRFQPKVVILDRDKMPIGLAAAVPIGAPTGNGGSFRGEEGWSYSPMGIMEFSNGPIRSKEYMVRASIYGGYHIRPQPVSTLLGVPFGNETFYGGALGFHPVNFLEIIGEYRGRIHPNGMPSEIMGGFKFHGDSVEANLAGGTGIVPGVGTPDYRIVFGVTVAPVFDPKARDLDGDGIPTGVDACPAEPEDIDGYQDGDGCPDEDNDGDGILDVDDGCPGEPEDMDGFQDEDGCEEPDNDQDNIVDGSDRCPNKPETRNGYLDEDGCPDTVREVKKIGDTDNDGFKDNIDKCPFDAEDKDGFEDDDGCPERDNDKDGVVDFEDKCPNAREVYNNVDDGDGCPDESMRVRIVKERIEINEKIYFDTGESTIRSESDDLIDEISSVILAHPEITRLRIEGHTDDVGSDVANLELSQSRAEAVKEALSERGVDAGRLDAAGFGELRPVELNETEEGKEKNRRVEFIIIERGG
jgi:large repetitive protein